MIPRRALPALLFAGCYLGVPAATAGESAPERIARDGTVTSASAVDLDADGRTDVVASRVERRGGRRVRFLDVLRQRDGRLPADGITALPVPDEAAAYVVADLLPAPGAEIAFVRSDGVEVVYAGGEELASGRALVRTDTFFVRGDAERLPRWDAAPDLDGDGTSEILLPVRDAYLLLAADEEGTFLERNRFRMPDEGSIARAAIDFLTAERRLPAVRIADHDGDGRDDLFFVRGEALRIHLQREGGRFADVPDVNRPLPFLDGSGREQAGRVEAHHVLLEDLDGDRRADMIVSRPSGRLNLLGGALTRVFVYRGGSGLFAEKPRQPLTVRGVSMPPRLVDLDRDGARDLVVSSIRMDVMSSLRSSVFRTLQVTYYAFRNRKGKGVFEEKPFVDHTVRFSLDTTQIGLAPVASFSGDHDGDGWRDLLTLTPEDRFCVYRGGEGGGFLRREPFELAKRPATVFDVGPGEGLLVERIDGDAASDFVVYGEGGLAVVLSAREDR